MKKEFSWADHEQELKVQIERQVKLFNYFINSESGKFLRQGDANYGKDWTSVLWWNDREKRIEVYDDEPQQLIDFYHFSEARTKVINSSTGEDVTKRYKFNPNYRDKI